MKGVTFLLLQNLFLSQYVCAGVCARVCVCVYHRGAGAPEAGVTDTGN